MKMVNRTYNHRQNSWLANKGTTQIEPSKEIKDNDNEAEGSCSNKKSQTLPGSYTKPIFKTQNPVIEEEARIPEWTLHYMAIKHGNDFLWSSTKKAYLFG